MAAAVAVLAGGPAFQTAAVHAASEPAQAWYVPLSERHAQLAELVALGMTNAEIAARLVISERTTKKHVQDVVRELELANRAEIGDWVPAHRP